MTMYVDCVEDFEAIKDGKIYVIKSGTKCELIKGVKKTYYVKVPIESKKLDMFVQSKYFSLPYEE